MKFTVLLALSFIVNIFSQNLDTIWSVNLSGPNDDRLSHMIRTSDNGILLTGYTSSYGTGGEDVWIVKIDSTGDTSWTKTYGGTLNDKGTYLLSYSSEIIYLVGNTQSYGTGDYDIWLMKLNNNGNIIWSKVYGTTDIDEANQIIKTKDGNLLITGSTKGSKGLFLLKLDTLGDTIWTKEYSNLPGYTYAEGVRTFEFQDDSLLMCGYVQWMQRQIFVMKTNAVGDSSYTKIFPTYIGSESISDAILTHDGNVVMVGYSSEHEFGLNDIKITCIDQFGNINWDKIFGGTDRQEAYSIIQKSNGNLLSTGFRVCCTNRVINSISRPPCSRTGENS